MPRTNLFTTAQRIRRRLSSGTRAEANVLLDEIDNQVSSDTLQLKYPLSGSWAAGGIVDLDLEQMYILSADDPNKRVKVIRGYNDSALDFHASAEVRVNSRFPLADVVDGMRAEVMSWPDELFAVQRTTVTVASQDTLNAIGTVYTYVIPSMYNNLTRVLEVRHQATTSLSPSDPRWPAVRARLERGVFSGSFYQLRLLDPVRAGSLQVVLGTPFDTTNWPADITNAVSYDLVDALGLQETMIDMLELGVMCRLMGDQEHQLNARDTAMGGANQQGTPPTSAVKDQGAMFAMYLRRRSEEMDRLRSLFPMRFN